MGNPNMQIGMPSVNPNGRPPSVFAGLSDRRSHYLKTLSRDEIIRIASDDTELNKVSSFDAMVLIGLAEALKETPEEKLDPSAAREKLYDREIGRAAQNLNVDHTGAVAVFSVNLSPLVAFIEEEDVGETTGDIPALVSERPLLPAPVRSEA